MAVPLARYDLVNAVLQAWVAYGESLTETPDPAVCEAGGAMLNDRLTVLAAICANHFEGDLVEIGVWRGYMTTRLCDIARRFQRHVIAIDPWEKNTEEYDAFQADVVPKYRDVLQVYRARSQDEAVVAKLLDTKLCFVYIDGEHSYEAVRDDIANTAHCRGIIACDDMNWNGGIRQAFGEARNKIQMRNNLFREGYLIPAV